MPARNSRGSVTIRDVTRKTFALEQLSKCITEEKNSHNNRTAVFSLPRSVPRDYKRDKECHLRQNENIRGLNLAVVKLTTVQVIKLPL
jgi:hypothetical protein